MKTAVIYSSKNKPGKKDATGAFVPEAKAFESQSQADYMLPLDCISQTTAVRKRVVGDFLRSIPEIGLLAIFCHGWSRGIQIGYTIPEVDILARALVSAADPIRIALYACWTADADGVADNDKVGPATEGGFADALRDALIANGHTGHIDAHKTAGHTSMNPYVVRFHLDPEVQNNGGEWIVQPGSLLWPRWVKALQGPMRYRFPILDTEEIAAQIRMGG